MPAVSKRLKQVVVFALSAALIYGFAGPLIVPTVDAPRDAFAVSAEQLGGVLSGQTLFAYGDSYVAGANAGDISKGFPALIADRGGATLETRAVGGTDMGTLVNVLSGGTQFPEFAWLPGSDGVVILKSVVNSVVKSANSEDAQMKTAFPVALRTALRILRAEEWRGETDPSVSYAGAWSAKDMTGTRGKTAMVSTVDGGAFEIVAPGGPIDLLLVGTPNDFGSDFAITVDGQPISAELESTKRIGTPTEAQQLVSVRVNADAGFKIAVVKTGSGFLGFDGYLIPAQNPPLIVVGKDATPSLAGLNINGADFNRTGENLEQFNRLLIGVTSEREFVDGGMVRTADPAFGWNPDGLYSEDLLHPNDIGHRAYAQAFARALTRPKQQP